MSLGVWIVEEGTRGQLQEGHRDFFLKFGDRLTLLYDEGAGEGVVFLRSSCCSAPRVREPLHELHGWCARCGKAMPSVSDTGSRGRRTVALTGGRPLGGELPILEIWLAAHLDPLEAVLALQPLLKALEDLNRAVELEESVAGRSWHLREVPCPIATEGSSKNGSSGEKGETVRTLTRTGEELPPSSTAGELP